LPLPPGIKDLKDFDKLTYAQCVKWLPLLIEYGGRERIDKIALEEWRIATKNAQK